MPVITVLNEKGGCGKTTVATTIASGLALKGHKVVLIDADAQGQASLAFGLKKEPCFYDLIVRGASWADSLRVVPPERYALPDNASDVTGALYLMPSNVETRSIAGNISDAFVVFNRIQEILHGIDFAIIDTSPSPSLLHGSIYMATDWILYPTLCEAWSFDGLRESLAHRSSFDPFREKFNLPPIGFAGVQPTRYRRRTLEHSENLKKLQQGFPGLVWPEIDESILWGEAATAKKAIFSHAPRFKPTKQAWVMVGRIEELAHERA